MLAAMPDLARTELIKGKVHHLMPTRPRHSQIVSLIVILLGIYNRLHNKGIVHTGETGLYTQRDPDTVRAMDCAFITHERWAQCGDDTFLTIAPELVVEVLSPSNTWTEMQQKLTEYFGVGAQIV